MTAVEIDKEYIEKAIKRISESIKQGDCIEQPAACGCTNISGCVNY